VRSLNTPARWPAALRGYGPLAAAVAAFVLMVALVPSRAPTGTTSTAGVAEVRENQVASGGDAAVPCAERSEQIPDDPYSPPCIEWSGDDNGGETARGVTADTITVSYRSSVGGADILTTMARLLPDAPPPDPDAVERTVEGLVEYFNEHFEFYGRRIELRTFPAKADPMLELTGAGQQQAEADAVTAATELGAFADVSATTEPYNAALAAKQVIAFGAPYLSDEYFAERRPYAWSFSPSCSTVSRATSESQVKTLEGRPARFAGDPALRTRTRKIAVISPENREYQNCLRVALDYLRDNDAEVITLSYPLDLASHGRSAENLLNRLQAEQVTSVACACDPLLPRSLTEAATRAGYRPEWLVMGTALTDSDIVGQLYEPSQWRNAFGITTLGTQFAPTESPAYQAFKSVRPDEEPAQSVETIYYQLYLLAIGIQMAGPELSAETFEKGMFAYPEHSGPGGTWRFGPGKYTPQTSASVVWWDPDTVSPVTGLPGTYQPVGDVYPIGEAPEEEPDVFNPATRAKR
jgi:hypothetical protein